MVQRKGSCKYAYRDSFLLRFMLGHMRPKPCRIAITAAVRPRYRHFSLTTTRRARIDVCCTVYSTLLLVR